MDRTPARPNETIADVLNVQARTRPHAVALEGVNGSLVTYAALSHQVERTRLALRGLGVRPTDRVAIVVPDGADAAVVFLSVAVSAIAAPLNHAYRGADLEINLSELHARAVIVPVGSDGDIVSAARALGLTMIEMVTYAERPGQFDLRCEGRAVSLPQAPDPTADSVALVLHTSGTTARPKIVPLTHANLLAASRYTAAALELGPSDRCLNVAPLCHTQGLVTALLAPLTVGGTVVCPPGFQAPRFFEWLDAHRATWFTATPALHQTILTQLAEHSAAPIPSTLRFVRSTAAVLPARLHTDLERVFGVPVINGYGMTEASPIIASNPLPPRVRKPGSVGLAAGPDVAILGEDGQPLGAHQSGIIAVRGPNVFHGYDGDAAANAEAFVDSWFLTGDQGYKDEEGYLFLTGRVTERINKGGEKIAPREVDDALLEHPLVAQVVTFGIPDPRLGETIAAAVVLRSGAHVSEQELREFVGTRLAFFKIPSRIVICNELPVGPTGKLRRVGLAAHLGLVPSAQPERLTRSNEEPRTPIERELARLWCAVLGVSHVGLHDNFFVVGGASIASMDLLVSIREHFAVDLPMQTFFQRPTIAGLAQKLELLTRQSHPSSVSSPLPTRSMQGDVERVHAGSDSGLLVCLQARGAAAPLFAIHGGGAGDVLLYRAFASHLGQDRPIYGVQAEGDWTGAQRPYQRSQSLEDLATRYLHEIRSVQARGPYHLAGASFGGIVAFEIAQQLAAQGEQVESLFLFDSHVRNNPFAGVSDEVGARRSGLSTKRMLRKIAARWPRLYRLVYAGHELRYRRRLRSRRPISAEMVSERFYRESRLLVSRYRPQPFDGRAVLFRALQDEDPVPLWKDLVRGGLEVHDMVGGHVDMMREPIVQGLAEVVRGYLAAGQRRRFEASQHRGDVAAMAS